MNTQLLLLASFVLALLLYVNNTPVLRSSIVSLDMFSPKVLLDVEVTVSAVTSPGVQCPEMKNADIILSNVKSGECQYKLVHRKGESTTERPVIVYTLRWPWQFQWFLLEIKSPRVQAGGGWDTIRKEINASTGNMLFGESTISIAATPTSFKSQSLEKLAFSAKLQVFDLSVCFLLLLLSL